MAKTATVELTQKEIGVLRRLIVEESLRLGSQTIQRESEWPSKLKRMRSVALKVLNAQQDIKGRPRVGRDGYPILEEV